MPKIKEKTDVILFLALEGSIFKKIKKVKFNAKPRQKNEEKNINKDQPKFITLDEDISKKIDSAIKNQKIPQKTSFLNTTVEIRKPCKKTPILPEFKTDIKNTQRNFFEKELFEVIFPSKNNTIADDLLKPKSRIFFFHKKKNKESLTDKIPRIKISKKENKQKKNKTKKKNKVTKAKNELDKAKQEIERKKQEIKEIERKAKEKEIELKKKKIEKEKRKKRLQREKKKQEKLKLKREKQIAKEKAKQKKLEEEKKKKLAEEKEKIRKQKEKEKKLREKKEKELKAKREKEEKKKEIEKQLAKEKEIKIKQKEKKKKQTKKPKKKQEKKEKKLTLNLFKPKKEESIPKTKEKIEVKKEQTLVNDDELSQALDIIDDLLGELPEEKIDQFAHSDDFEIYEKVLKKYRKK